MTGPAVCIGYNDRMVGRFSNMVANSIVATGAIACLIRYGTVIEYSDNPVNETPVTILTI